MQNIDSYKELKGKALTFIKIKSNSTSSVRDAYDVKVFSRLRRNFKYVNGAKARHDSKDGTNCNCNCGSATEAKLNFLLLYQQYQTIRLYTRYNFDPLIRSSSNDKLLHLLLCGSKLHSFEINREIITLTIKILKSSELFERPLL